MLIISMAELHKRLYDMAVKLSVYSSVLDFGLAISTILLGYNIFDKGQTAFLVALFDDAITYITFTIITMFAAVIFLREKTRIVHISPYKQPQARIVSKLKVYLPSTELEQKKAVIVNKETKRAVTPYDQTQYIINGKQEAFVKFNGLWYQYVSGRFERVKQPEYS